MADGGSGEPGRLPDATSMLTEAMVISVLGLLEKRPDLRNRVAQMFAAQESKYVDAEMSGLGPKTFRKAARDGEFRVFRPGRKYLALRAEVDAYIERCRVDLEGESAAKGQRTGAADADPLDRAIASGRIVRRCTKQTG